MRNRIGLLIALSLGLGLLSAGCSNESGLSSKVPDAAVKPGADKPAAPTGQPGFAPKGKKGAAPMMPPP